MNLEDKVAVEWMAKFTRDPLPEKVVWKQSSVTHDRFYWLAVPKGQAMASSLVIASRMGNAIEIEQAEGVNELIVLLNDSTVDLDQPVTVKWKGRELFNARAKRTIGSLHQTLEERGDPMLVFDALVKVRVGEE
jgi:hypothetical protein